MKTKYIAYVLIAFLAVFAVPSYATITDTEQRVTYNCNGANRTFDYTWEITETGAMVVILVDSTGSELVLTETTHYEVTGAGVATGGTVTTVEAYASGNKILLIRDEVIEQETDYIENDPFHAETHEDALDKLTMIDQDQEEEFDRTLRVSRSSSVSGGDLELTPVASRVLGWDSSAAALTTYSTTTAYSADFMVLNDDYSNDIATAVAAIGAGNQTVVIDRNTDAQTALVNVGANTQFMFINGGKIIQGGYALNFPGGPQDHIIALPGQQIFDGTGTVTWGAGGVEYPNWRGAVGDNSTDSTNAINASIAALYSAGGGIVQLSEGIYRHTGIIHKSHVTLAGLGQFVTYLRLNHATADGIKFDTTADVDYPTIRDMTIDCVTSSTGTGILADGTTIARDPIIERIYIEDFDDGIALAWALNGVIRNSRLTGPGKGTAGSIGIRTYASVGGTTTTMVCDGLYVVGYETNWDLVSHPNTVLSCISGASKYHFHSRGSVSIRDLWIESFDTATDKAFKTTLGRFFINHVLRVYTAVGGEISWDDAAMTDFDATGLDSVISVFRSFARAYVNAEQTITTATNTRVAFNAVTLNVGSCFDPTTNYRFTAVKPRGDFTVAATVYWKTHSLDSWIAIYVDGVQYSNWANNSVANYQVSISDVVRLDRGSYVEIYARQNSGTDKVIDNGSDKSWLTIVESK